METQGKLPKKHHDKAVGGGLAAHHNAGLQGSLWREARMAGAEEGRGESEERSLEQHDTFPSTGRRLGGGGDEGLSCWVWGEEGVGCDDPLSFKHTGTHFAQKHTHTPLLQADVTTAQPGF